MFSQSRPAATVRFVYRLRGSAGAGRAPGLPNRCVAQATPRGAQSTERRQKPPLSQPKAHLQGAGARQSRASAMRKCTSTLRQRRGRRCNSEATARQQRGNGEAAAQWPGSHQPSRPEDLLQAVEVLSTRRVQLPATHIYGYTYLRTQTNWNTSANAAEYASAEVLLGLDPSQATWGDIQTARQARERFVGCARRRFFWN